MYSNEDSVWLGQVFSIVGMVGTNLVWDVGGIRPSFPQKAVHVTFFEVDGMAGEMPAGRPHDMPITCEPGTAMLLPLTAAKYA